MTKQQKIKIIQAISFCLTWFVLLSAAAIISGAIYEVQKLKTIGIPSFFASIVVKMVVYWWEWAVTNNPGK